MYARFSALASSMRRAMRRPPGTESSAPFCMPVISAITIASTNGCRSREVNEPKSRLNAHRLIVSIVSLVMSAVTSIGPSSPSQTENISAAVSSIVSW